MVFQSINPATGEPIESYPAMSDVQAAAVVRAVAAEQLSWRRTTFSDRAAAMRRVAALLRERRNRYAQLMAAEMGKPLAQGAAEVDKCAANCEYYAGNAEEFLAIESVETEASRSFVAHEPLGVVLAVMPWNFPLWQVFRFAAPALMAGNTGVLKHASNVPGCALAIEEVFRDAGLPHDCFRTLLVGSRQVDALIANPAIAAVTLTGSTVAGKAVAAKAGEMLKKTVLELGGSDAYVVLDDADLDAAADACVTSRLINSGQSCIAAKRFVVLESISEPFQRRFVELMRGKRVGHPTDDGVDVGPMAREDLRDELHEQVRASIAAGARCVLGGEIPDRAGAWYPPTVLTGVKPGMPAYDDELFGPVAAIITAADEADAVRIANDSVFGLGAAVFTGDAARGERIATRELQAGCCFVNDFVRSDPRLPFGGIKQSGYGRELGEYGIKEFVNTKTVYVK